MLKQASRTSRRFREEITCVMFLFRDVSNRSTWSGSRHPPLLKGLKDVTQSCVIGARGEIKKRLFSGRIASTATGVVASFGPRVLNNAWNLFPGIESNRASSPARRHDDKRAGINLNNFNPRIFIIPMTIRRHANTPGSRMHERTHAHMVHLVPRGPVEYACAAVLSALGRECQTFVQLPRCGLCTPRFLHRLAQPRTYSLAFAVTSCRQGRCNATRVYQFRRRFIHQRCFAGFKKCI